MSKIVKIEVDNPEVAEKVARMAQGTNSVIRIGDYIYDISKVEKFKAVIEISGDVDVYHVEEFIGR